MVKVVCAEDCGNAPKRLRLKAVLTALARGNDAVVLKNLTEAVTWNRVGARPLKGTAGIARMLEQMKRDPFVEMRIESIITHGADGAANGTYRTRKGRAFAFCHIYHFNSAGDTRIRAVTEYLIRARPGGPE